MNIFQALFEKAQQTAKPALTNINKAGSNLYGTLNTIYNTADKTVGGYLPGGVRPSNNVPTNSIPRYTKPSIGTSVPGVKPKQNPIQRFAGQVFEPIKQYVQEIPEKGAIPMFSLTPTDEAIKTAAKYAAGPLGRQMRIIRSPITNQRLQEQVDAATVRDGQLIHGLGEPGYEKTKFPSNIQGAGIAGQFIGRPTEDNRVEVNEPYDTKPSSWHLSKVGENLKRGDLINAAESVGNTVFAGLGESGWANMYPRGQVQDIGEVKSWHPLYRGK